MLKIKDTSVVMKTEILSLAHRMKMLLFLIHFPNFPWPSLTFPNLSDLGPSPPKHHLTAYTLMKLEGETLPKATIMIRALSF